MVSLPQRCMWIAVPLSFITCTWDSARYQSSYPLTYSQFRASEKLFRDSSDEDNVDGSAIHHIFDEMYEHQDSFPFVVGARVAPVTHLHPSSIHIFQLWQVYINNINPLLRITHAPTAQGRVIEASAHLEGVSSGLKAFMFAVYLIALISFEDAEVQAMFGEAKMRVVSRFQLVAQQTLINAGLMRTSDITVLQAYILYLVRPPFFPVSLRRLTPAGRCSPVYGPPPDLLPPRYCRPRRPAHGAPPRPSTIWPPALRSRAAPPPVVDYCRV